MIDSTSKPIIHRFKRKDLVQESQNLLFSLRKDTAFQQIVNLHKKIP